MMMKQQLNNESEKIDMMDCHPKDFSKANPKIKWYKTDYFQIIINLQLVLCQVPFLNLTCGLNYEILISIKSLMDKW